MRAEFIKSLLIIMYFHVLVKLRLDLMVSLHRYCYRNLLLLFVLTFLGLRSGKIVEIIVVFLILVAEELLVVNFLFIFLDDTLGFVDFHDFFYVQVFWVLVEVVICIVLNLLFILLEVYQLVQDSC